MTRPQWLRSVTRKGAWLDGEVKQAGPSELKIHQVYSAILSILSDRSQNYGGDLRAAREENNSQKDYSTLSYVLCLKFHPGINIQLLS